MSKRILLSAFVLFVSFGNSLLAETFSFPQTGTDTISVSSNPYWWHIGDYAEGTRSVTHSTQSGELRLSLPANGLSTACSPGNWVDLDLSINGTVVATHRVNVGDSTAVIPFNLAGPVTGTTTVRIEETNEVCPGGGSIQIDSSGLSEIEFYQATSVPALNALGLAAMASLLGLTGLFARRRLQA